MAIVFDTANMVGSTADIDTYTVPLVIGVAGANRILMAGISTISTAAISTFKFAGLNMTLVTSYIFGSHKTFLYRLVGPPVGAGNLVAVFTFALPGTVGGATYTGVDQITPLGAAASGNGGAAYSVPLVSATGELAFGVGLTGNYKNWGVYDTTMRTKLEGGGYIIDGILVDKAGAPAVSVGAATTGVYMMMSGVPIKPYRVARARQVKYYFNIWDPKHEVTDTQGQVVDPNKILPDNFIDCDGYMLGDPKFYDNFVADPSKSRIVSVGLNQGNVSIKTSKSQFADVIVKRAAAGRM